MALDAVIQGANNVLKMQIGIARVHENAPESLADLPATILVPQKGTLDWPRKPNQRLTTHDLQLTLYVSRAGDLASADQALKPWVDKIIDLFDQNITLQGAAFSAGIVDYQYGHVEYGGTPYLGITFTLRAVEIATLNYHG
jgi:hypothetical protein